MSLYLELVAWSCSLSNDLSGKLEELIENVHAAEYTSAGLFDPARQTETRHLHTAPIDARPVSAMQRRLVYQPQEKEENQQAAATKRKIEVL